MKKILLSAMAAILVIGLAACGSNTDPSTEITVASTLWSDPAEQEYIVKEILPGFEEETGIKVNLEVIDHTTMMDAMTVQQDSGNVTYDVIISNTADMATWINAGYVVPITELVNGFTDRTFYTVFDDSLKANGEQYFVPITADVYLTLASNEAIAYAPEGYEDGVTWEEYAQWAINIANGEGAGKTIMPYYSGKMFIYQFGALSLSYGSTYPSINDEGAMAAWALIEEMAQGNAFIPAMSTMENPVDSMKRGESWLTVFHMANLGQIYSASPADYVLLPAPKGPNGTGTIAGASGIGMVNNSDNVEGAKLFIEYITRPSILADIARGTGGFIPPVDEVKSELDATEEIDAVILAGLATLETGTISGVPASEYSDWTAVKNVFERTFDDIISGEVSTSDQAYFDEKQAEIDALKL